MFTITATTTNGNRFYVNMTNGKPEAGHTRFHYSHDEAMDVIEWVETLDPSLKLEMMIA